MSAGRGGCATIGQTAAGLLILVWAPCRVTQRMTPRNWLPEKSQAAPILRDDAAQNETLR